MNNLVHIWQQLGYGPFWPVITILLLATLVGMGSYIMVLNWQDSQDAVNQMRNLK